MVSHRGARLACLINCHKWALSHLVACFSVSYVAGSALSQVQGLTHCLALRAETRLSHLLERLPRGVGIAKPRGCLRV